MLQVFFDLSIDGKPEGRVVIQVFSDSPISDQRFSDLSKGKMGVGYRRSKVDSVNDVRGSPEMGKYNCNIMSLLIALHWPLVSLDILMV